MVIKVCVAVGMMVLMVAGTMFFAESASAHGYIESPTSRAYMCKQGKNINCGPIQYEPQSVEGVGSFPQSGPPDGQITGAGHYPDLYTQTADRWKKVTMQGGTNTFKWKLAALHSTKEWKYYITKKGWNPNKPLARSDLDLAPFCYFNDDGKRPATTVSHSCNVPTDRSGYHLILAVWEIADTTNAFYQVIDVNLVNSATTEQSSIDMSKAIVEQQATHVGMVSPIFSTVKQIEQGSIFSRAQWFAGDLCVLC
ncbi:chitin-binding protein [Brevibacillus laterosporus]|uniref:Chitin-binding protein n=1 Tax=Brevibacillus laterosporus TaxID=1465 RepID=A0A518VFL6_BRELA|nr:chitin-binding protein [Brevibacillus laterosporus]